MFSEIQHTHKKQHTLSLLALFLSAVLWASAVIVLKDSLESLSPAWILAFRFCFAGLLLFVILIPKLRKITTSIWKHGIWMGIILYIEFWFFTVGLKYTTSSKATFTLASYIMILPLLYWIVRKKKPRWQDLLASFLCMAGLSFILFGSFDGINQGDLMIIVSAAFYALHIIYTGIYAKKEDFALLNLVQIGTGGILSLGMALVTSPFPVSVSENQMFSILYLAVGCTILPYMLSVFGQKYVKTSTSGVILSFESVFGCLFSIVFLGDQINLRFILGAIIVTSAFFVVETK